MKVLLIYPPNENMLTTNLPSFVEEEKGFYPPLGLMYVAAYAEKNTEYEVEILDAQVERLDYDAIEGEIERRKPDIVGIQAMTFTLVDVIATAKIVKRVNKDIKVVLGGPHVNIYPNETIGIPEVDYLILGEGEITFAELIQNPGNTERLKKIRGLVFKEGEKVVNTGLRKLIDDLDTIPFPARHLTPYKKYYSLLAKRPPVTTMMTSRGCPYKCLFCDRPHLGKKFRARSAKNVVDEMENCVDMGIKELLLYDDTFAVNRQRVLDICAEILTRGLDVGWDIRTRVDNVDKELLEKLREAGCERIHYGVESGNPEILKILRKGITVEQSREAFKLTKDIGIKTLAYFMIGSPRETKSQILETIEFAKKLEPDFVHFSVTTPYPATPLYYMGLEEGRLKNDYWQEFARNPTKNFVPELWEENLSREELIELLKSAYKGFYVRPKYVLKRVFEARSFEEFKRKAKAALRVFRA
ncbi:B12-binding domain-containing radical SAM protein [Chloroflexota bacterium]